MTKNVHDQRDEIPFLNHLFLTAFYEICRHAEAPEDFLKNIESVMDARQYDLGAKIRNEARSVGRDFALRLLDDIAQQCHESDNDERDNFSNNHWNNALVPDERAEQNKTLWRIAICSGKHIDLSYISYTSGYAQRIVKPTGIKGAYGEGYCFLRKDNRVFRFDKMLEAKLVD